MIHRLIVCRKSLEPAYDYFIGPTIWVPHSRWGLGKRDVEDNLNDKLNDKFDQKKEIQNFLLDIQKPKKNGFFVIRTFERLKAKEKDWKSSHQLLFQKRSKECSARSISEIIRTRSRLLQGEIDYKTITIDIKFIKKTVK